MLFVPLFSYMIYPAMERVIRLDPLRKVLIGFFLAAVSFGFSAVIQAWIDRGSHPHVIWQVANYVVITAAEVMVSITCLEFSYTQAPKTMKSLVMGLFFLSVTLGNLLTSAVNFLLIGADGEPRLTGPQYYWFFAALMFITALAFIGVVATFKQRTYIQDEAT
jgi:POT family proton-dependent oligopeptide transporter